MTISVRCACGAKLKAKEKLAGKRVACPTCKKPLLIPNPEPAEETLLEPLIAGEDFDAGSEPVAESVADPLSAAEDPLSPSLDPLSPSSDPLGLGNLSDDSFATGQSAGPTLSPLPAQKTRPPEAAGKGRQAGGTASSRYIVLIAAIGGGAFLGLVLVMALVAFLLSRRGQDVAGTGSDIAAANQPGGDAAENQPADNTANNNNQPAADANSTSGAVAAGPSAASVAVSSDSLANELRTVIRELIDQTGVELSPAKVETEVEARYQEGVESVRKFYPDFLDPTAPNHALPPEERIDIAKTATTGIVVFPHDVPLVSWLLEQHKKGELDAHGVELFAELFQAEFRIGRHHANRFDERRNAQAATEKELFPASQPSLKYGKLSIEERQCHKDLRKIVIGIGGFPSKLGAYPKVPPLAAGQQAGLSWRVHVLPYLREQELYDQFKLDEPWDSPHNRPLIDKMPAFYKSPGVTEPGMTAVHVFTGDQTLFRGGVTLADVTDGKSKTLGCVVTGPERAVEWTRPGGIEFDPEAGMRVLGTRALEGGIPVAFLDSAVQSIPRDIPFSRFAQWILPADGGTAERDLAWAGNRPDVRARWPFGELDKPQGPADRLKRVGFAMQGYHNQHKHFPTAQGNGAGQTGLSWRVHLLPFLGEQQLYDEFNLDEPWDGPHNLQLVDRMPEAFRWPGVPDNRTVIHVLTGQNSPFDQENGPRYSDFVDGTSNTIMAVLGSPDTAVEWSRPGGIPFDPNEPFGSLFKLENGYAVIEVTGWPSLVELETTPEEFSKLVTHRDGQVFRGKRIIWKTF